MLHFSKTTKLALGLCTIALLGACSNLKQLEKANPQPGDFSSSLASEYLAYSDSEADQYDWVDSEHFARKGIKASKGGEVYPEELVKWKIPGEKIESLTNARQRLVNVLTPDIINAVPQKAARAQLLFDCWVEQQEENWQGEDIAACSVEFMNAIQELEGVKPHFIVYFDFDKSGLTRQGRSVVRTMADYIKTLDKSYAIYVAGHTDLSGGDAYNQKLSQARVKAVKKALISHGVPADRISADAFGKARPAVPTNDGVPELKNRRVEVDIIQKF